MRRTHEPPIESVGPSVIRALNAPGERALRRCANSRTSVPANVIESMNGAVLIAIDNDAFISDLADKKVTGYWNLILASNADPGLAEESFELVRKNSRIRVVARWKSLADAVCLSRHENVPRVDFTIDALRANLLRLRQGRTVCRNRALR